jgi:uncharacterized protein YndB with AHSA1/START domain
MKSFATTTTIDASVGSVWALLTDAPGYAGWTSTVATIEGRIAPGRRSRCVPRHQGDVRLHCGFRCSRRNRGWPGRVGCHLGCSVGHALSR